ERQVVRRREQVTGGRTGERRQQARRLPVAERLREACLAAIGAVGSGKDDQDEETPRRQRGEAAPPAAQAAQDDRDHRRPPAYKWSTTSSNDSGATVRSIS